MEAIEDWESHNTTDSLGHSRHRLFLPEALAWPSLVVEASVLRDEAQKMALARLHEVTSPGNVGTEESAPALAVAGDPLLHVPLHGALRDLDLKGPSEGHATLRNVYLPRTAR